MTSFLSLDTSSPSCSVVLAVDDRLISRRSSTPRAAAQQLLPMIQECLTEADIGLAGLDAIAVVSGPGSFTGLRIGVGVAQGLAMANNTPVITLSSLAITALGACRKYPGEKWLVAMKARENEFYLGAYYRDENEGVCLIGAELVATAASVEMRKLSASLNGNWHGAGDAWEEGKDALVQAMDDRPQSCAPWLELDMKDVCALAKIRLDKRQFSEIDQVLPNYVKEQMDYS